MKTNATKTAKTKCPKEINTGQDELKAVCNELIEIFKILPRKRQHNVLSRFDAYAEQSRQKRTGLVKFFLNFKKYLEGLQNV